MTKLINTIRAIVMFTLLLLILIFCFQNRDAVSISFLKMNIEQLPLFIALLGTLSTGLLIGFLAGLLTGSKSKNRKEEEKIIQQETKINTTEIKKEKP